MLFPTGLCLRLRNRRGADVRVIDGGALRRAVLTLVLPPAKALRGLRQRCPTLRVPTGLLDFVRMLSPGDVATNRPVQACRRNRDHSDDESVLTPGDARCAKLISFFDAFGVKSRMPDLGRPLRRKTDARRLSSEYRCIRCREVLHFAHRDISLGRLGTAVKTEVYLCLACDAGYAFNRATRKWKPWVTDDDEA